MARISPLSGYTFVEILVVALIMGIALSLGLAGIREFSQRQLLEGVVKTVRSDLRLAQANAFSGKKPDHANCNTPNYLRGYYYNVVFADNYRITAACSAGNVMTKNIFLPAGMTMTSSRNPILFKVLGQGTNIPAGSSSVITLTQTATGKTRTITIYASGEIK